MRINVRSRAVALLLLIACGSSAILSQQRRASSINETTLKAHIKFLADDPLEGRGTGARGGELAAKYIASQLEEFGLKVPARTAVSFNQCRS
jgi:hypothetical protein